MSNKNNIELDNSFILSTAQNYLDESSIMRDMCLKLPQYVINIKYASLFKSINNYSFYKQLIEILVLDYGIADLMNKIDVKNNNQKCRERRSELLGKLDKKVFGSNGHMSSDMIKTYAEECARLFVEADGAIGEWGEDETLRSKYEEKRSIVESILENFSGTTLHDLATSKKRLKSKSNAEGIFIFFVCYLSFRKYFFYIQFENQLLIFQEERNQELSSRDRSRIEELLGEEFVTGIVKDIGVLDFANTPRGGRRPLLGKNKKTNRQRFQELLDRHKSIKEKMRSNSETINTKVDKLKKLIEESAEESNSIFNEISAINVKLNKMDEFSAKDTFFENSIIESGKAKENVTKQVVNFTSSLSNSVGFELGKMLGGEVESDWSSVKNEALTLGMSAIGTIFFGPIGGALLGGIMGGFLQTPKEDPTLLAINALQNRMDSRFDHVDDQLNKINSNIHLVFNQIQNLTSNIESRFQSQNLYMYESFEIVFKKLDSIIHKLEYADSNNVLRQKYYDLDNELENFYDKIKIARESIENDLKNGHVKHRYLIDGINDQYIYTPYELEEVFMTQFSALMKRFYDKNFSFSSETYEVANLPSEDTLCYLMRSSGSLYFAEALSIIQKISLRFTKVANEYLGLRKSFNLIYYYKFCFSDHKSEKSKSELFEELILLKRNSNKIHLSTGSITLMKSYMISNSELGLHNQLYNQNANSFFFGGYHLYKEEGEKKQLQYFDRKENKLSNCDDDHKYIFEDRVFYPVIENSDSKAFDFLFWEDPDRSHRMDKHVFFGRKKGEIILAPKKNPGAKSYFVLKNILNDDPNSFITKILDNCNQEYPLDYDPTLYTPFQKLNQLVRSKENKNDALLIEFFPYTTVVLKNYFKYIPRGYYRMGMKLYSVENEDGTMKHVLHFGHYVLGKNFSRVENVNFAKLDLSDLKFNLSCIAAPL